MPKTPPLDTATMLRFPLLFGGILGIFVISFKYRHSLFMSDIEEKRLELNREDVESRKILQTRIDEARRSMFSKT